MSDNVPYIDISTEVKNGLREKLQSRRSGQPEIIIENCFVSENNVQAKLPDSAEDLHKKEKRRENKRISAAKCREHKKKNDAIMKKKYQDTINENKMLRKRLAEALRRQEDLKSQMCSYMSVHIDRHIS